MSQTTASSPPQVINLLHAAAPQPNQPWFCPAGAFAGKHLVAELVEVQSAHMGRKYSAESASDADSHRKDGRPINPHPVVRVRLFTCDQNGGDRREIDPNEIEASGNGIMMLCNVTLYPYNHGYDNDLVHFPPGVPIPPTPILSGQFDNQLATENTYPPPGMPAQPRKPLSEEHDSLRHLTHGARDVQYAIVPAFGRPVGSDEMAIYFVFKDLMVADTGHFVLKYRFMLIDYEFLMNGVNPPTLASCWGGVFAVYPSKKAPNLKRSTPLEWHLHKFGGHISHPRAISPDRRAGSAAGRGRARGRARGGAPSSNQRRGSTRGPPTANTAARRPTRKDTDEEDQLESESNDEGDEEDDATLAMQREWKRRTQLSQTESRIQQHQGTTMLAPQTSPAPPLHVSQAIGLGSPTTATSPALSLSSGGRSLPPMSPNSPRAQSPYSPAAHPASPARPTYPFTHSVQTPMYSHESHHARAQSFGGHHVFSHDSPMSYRQTSPGMPSDSSNSPPGIPGSPPTANNAGPSTANDKAGALATQRRRGRYDPVRGYWVDT